MNAYLDTGHESWKPRSLALPCAHAHVRFSMRGVSHVAATSRPRRGHVPVAPRSGRTGAESSGSTRPGHDRDAAGTRPERDPEVPEEEEDKAEDAAVVGAAGTLGWLAGTLGWRERSPTGTRPGRAEVAWLAGTLAEPILIRNSRTRRALVHGTSAERMCSRPDSDVYRAWKPPSHSS